jgi:cell division protein FtsQ
VKKFGLLFLCGGAAFYGGIWLVQSGTIARAQNGFNNALIERTADAGFIVRNVLVDGRQYADVATIRAMLNVDKGDPIFSLNPKEAQVMLERMSWVKNAHVERRLPDTIYIKLTERKPLALWQRNKRLSLIDSEGKVLTDQNLGEFQKLMIVIGDDAPKRASSLLTMLSAEPAIRDRVEAATLVSGRRWDLKLKSGAEVKLPEKDMGLALRKLAVNHEEEAILDKDVLSIDVRDGGRITVRTKPGAASDFNAGITPAAGNAI